MKQLKWTFILAAISLMVASAPAQEKKLKLRVAVVPLEWEKSWIEDWQIPIEFRNAIYEKLVEKLVATGRFIVLERDAMDALLKEQAIKEDNSGESQKGKIVPAQALIAGKVVDFTLAKRGAGGGAYIPGVGTVGGSVSEARVKINVRMFNVDTSEVIATESANGSASAAGFAYAGRIAGIFTSFGAFDKSPLGNATNKAIDQCVEKILKKVGAQPWSCRVADWDSDAKEITINAGSLLGVSEGNKFDVYRITKIIKDPETGEILGKKTTKVGMIRVTSVDEKFSIAEVIEGSDFQTGDIVREIR